MSGIARFAVLATALMSLLGAVSATAGAVTWHNTGNTAYTATISSGTLSATGSNGFVCGAGGVMTASVTSGPFVGTVWPAETGTAKFTGCSGGGTLDIDCAFSVTANSWTNLTPAITHAVTHVNCGVYSSGVNACRVVGTLNSATTNPTSPTAGTVTSVTKGNLVTTNGTGATCPIGNNEPAHLSVMKATVTNGTGGSGSLGPIITRTS